MYFFAHDCNKKLCFLLIIQTYQLNIQKWKLNVSITKPCNLKSQFLTKIRYYIVPSPSTTSIVMPAGQKWKALSILEQFFIILGQPANKKQQQIFNAPLEKMSFHCAAYLMTLSAALSYEHLHTANRLLIQGGGKYGKFILFKSCWSLSFWHVTYLC